MPDPTVNHKSPHRPATRSLVAAGNATDQRSATLPLSYAIEIALAVGENRRSFKNDSTNTIACMLALSTVTTTWILSVLAALLGSTATYLLSRSGDRRRLAADDERRWLNDRRTLYARYLGLVETLERDADSIACFLPHDEDALPMTEEDEQLTREMSQEWMERWDTELQPLLSEMELLATPDVADLAARAAHGILSAVPQPQYLGPGQSKMIPDVYSEHWPTQQMAKGLLELLRNAMRTELGLDPVSNRALGDRDWPWLRDQPSFEDHHDRMGRYLWPHSARDHPGD